MSEERKTDLAPADRVDDIPRILEALQQAVQEALQRHKRDGNPVAVWRDGRVVWIPPEEIPAPEDPVPDIQVEVPAPGERRKGD